MLNSNLGMKLWIKDKLVQKLLSLPNGCEIYTSQRWSDTKKSKILYEMRKLGFVKQLGRFRFIRTVK